MCAPSVEERSKMVSRGPAARRRREDDDVEKHSAHVLGVIELLRNPRNRLYLVTLVAATLFLIPFNFYVSQFSIGGQFVIGVMCGLFIQGVYLFYCVHRTHQRRRKVWASF
jgi:hypothetical protein